MRIQSPTRFFVGSPGDVDYSQNLKNNRLVAFGDIVCEYSLDGQNWNGTDYTEDTNDQQIRFVRFSFDGGITYTGAIATYPINGIRSFFVMPPTQSVVADEQNLIYLYGENNPHYAQDPTYEWAVRLVLNESDYNMFKYSRVHVCVQNSDKTMIKTNIDAPIIFVNDGTNYYVDMLVTENFFLQFTRLDLSYLYEMID